MKTDVIPRAKELLDELKTWELALQRAGHGIFKEAHLRVVDASHGHPGVDSRAQSAESIVPLGADEVRMLCEHKIGRIRAELRELGFDA
jgi:hypothetical protein